MEACRVKDEGSLDDQQVLRIGQEFQNSELAVTDEIGEHGEDNAICEKSGHTCEICHRMYRNKRDFLLHQYNHKEKSTYYCAFCFKTFPSEYAFKRHSKFHEKKKNKSIHCRICDKEFEYVKDLEEHHRQSHLNEKLFRCKHCKATFSWRENLNKHMRMHETPTSKTDHKCEKCARAFMDNISLRLHICDAKKKTATERLDKPFVCKICNKAFKFDFSFEAHMNSHEGPVALNAYKKMQQKALEEKKKLVQMAASKQLQTKTSPNYNKSSLNIAVQASNKSKKSESNNCDQNGSNLQEIVLEIVNVNELPKVDTAEGTEILAQGDEDVTVTVPLSDASFNSVPNSNIKTEYKEQEGQTMWFQSPEDPKSKNEEDKSNCLVDNLSADVAATKDDTSKKLVKRSKRPLLYDYVMTEEKPFQCPECKKEFRWEISLNIHLQEHLDGGQHTKNTRNKNMKKKTSCTSLQVTSKIVYRRESSDEEDDYHAGDFSYSDLIVTPVSKKKRGRPRKEIETTKAHPPKRRRGRPPKDLCHVKRKDQSGNKSVMIKVMHSTANDQYQIKDDIDLEPPIDGPDVQFEVHIPKHRLIRLYLLRQLKLSRNRGFFPCRFCNKPFSCKASLNMHILRHTGKGSYRCSHCNQKFPDHRTLVLHRLIEEEEAMDSAYQCNTCCRACTTSKSLMNHIQRHLATVWPSSKPRAKVMES